MFNKIVEIFKIKDLRNRVLFVLALLGIFRLAAHIPVPAVDLDNLRKFFESNQIFGLLNMFSGGAMDNFSVVAMGVGPYITASIIMQLLQMVVPSLERLAKEEGEAGRRKISQITRILTVPMAALQGYGLLALFRRAGQGIVPDLTPYEMVVTLVTLTAGSIFLMWLGELMTEKGIGNGISLIIFAGIVAGIPGAIQQAIVNFDSTKILSFVAFGIVAVIVIAAIVFITEAQRNIPVSYARRVRGNKMYGGTSSHLPLRLNQAGVIPIIFAMSVMIFPGMLANFFMNAKSETVANAAKFLADLFNNQLFYGILYFILVVFFTYFYTAVTFDPKQISENIQRQGGFVPGIRPGRFTAEYLHRTLNRITLAGALFLGLVAVLPFILQTAVNIPGLVIGGTGILIVVSVVIETVKQVESQMVMRDYESFY